ncbi:MAG: DUF3298 domain-containing protein [Chloroflexi bacterium]|nr:DUF3298 domain-containing protein [Chloroflexota bacterium]
MKTKITLPLILILLAALACNTQAFPAPQPTAAPTLQPTQTEAISESVTLTSIPFNEENEAPPFTVTAQTPNLIGNEEPRVLAFNNKMTALVQSEIESFKSDVLQYASTPPISAGSSLDIQYSLIGQRGDFWSIKFEIMGYADGAAHPYHYSITVNYDLEKGKEITLDEIFLPNSNYLQKISELCKAELAARDIGFEGFSQGADPLPENYQRWNVSDQGLMITFDEYQVAAYAAGPQVVVIPFGELGGLVDYTESGHKLRF